MTQPLGGSGKTTVQLEPVAQQPILPQFPSPVAPVEKPGVLTRLWNGVKGAAAQGVSHAGHFATVRIVSNLDKNKEQVEAELTRLRGKLEKSTGTPDIANLIGRQSRDNFPRLLDLFRDKVRNQWLRETLEYTLVSSPNLLQNSMEATLLKMMDNLVERVKADAAANGTPLPEPIPPKELIERIMALGAAVGGEEINGFKKLQDLEGSEHEIPGFYETSPDYEERTISEKMTDKLLNVALPNGSSDLILPPGLAGSILSWAGYELLGSYLLPEMISQLNAKTTNMNHYHVGFLGYLKEVSSDGEVVSNAIHPVIAKFAEWLQTKAKESGDTISDPLLRGLVGPFLKDSEHSSGMRLLLQKTDTFLYPLAIHLLGNLAVQAEESGERNKPLLTMVSHVILKDLMEFANQNKREDLGKALAAYENAVQEIQTSAEQEIKAIEKQSGEAIAAIVASRTAERDRKIAEVKTETEIKAIQKKYSELIAAETAPLKVAGDNRKSDIKKQMEQKLLATKSPFSPLIASLMQKMGADEEGLATILPFFQKEASEKIGEIVNAICIDYFKAAVMQEGQPPAAAARMVGQKEARTLIQDIVKKAIPTLKKGFTEKEEKGPLRELMASADMDVIQSYAEPYLADLVSDLLVHLADSNPLMQGQEQVDMVSSAIQNLARLASEKLENSRFRSQAAELVTLPEGPAKEAKKNLLLAPVVQEIVKRVGWEDEDKIRLPKLLRGKAKEMLEKDILPDLIYRGVQLWLGTRETHLDNEIALQQQTTDGDAVTKVVKTLADNTGAIVADIAHKTGVAIETSVARPKEAGLEYLIRDEIGSAIQKYPFLAQLKDHVLQNSLVQILKDMRGQPTLLKETDKLSYPILMHALAKLTQGERKGEPKGEPKQSTAGAVVNRLLRSIFSFAGEHREKLSGAWSEHQKRLDVVEQEFPDADTPQANTPEAMRAKAEKLKEARKPFKVYFQPLIDDVFQKAGLDPEGLSKVLTVGAKPLSELIQSEALDFCVDFYEEVVATQGRAPDIARDMPGYQEGRHLFQGMMVELMPAIREALAKKENQNDIQTALADEINDRLFHGKLPLDKDWIMQPVAELVSEESPHFQQLRGFAEPYLVDTVTDLFAQLAASYKEGDMAERAIAHLTAIMMNEVKDPELAKKLAEWKVLPENSEEEKRAKSKEKTRLREEIFGACSEKVLEAAGWNDPKNIRAPKALRPVVKRLMEKTVLPDQLFRIAADMLIPQPLSKAEQRSLDEMGSTHKLKKIADGIAEKLIPTIFSKTREYADLIAAKCNEKLTLNSLNVHDEASLANNIDRLLAEGNEELKPAWKFTEGLLSRNLQDGLSRLALNYDGPNQGDLASNIALYLRKKLKDFSFPAGIGQKIRDYTKHVAPLKALDGQISELRKLALREHHQVEITVQEAVAHYKAEQGALQLAQQNKQLDRLLRDHVGNTKLTAKIIKRQKELPAKIAAELDEQFKFAESFQDRPLDEVLREQKKERAQLEARLNEEFGIKATYQEILKAFEPEVKNILTDMGYATAKELPVPYFLKDTLWKNLADTILPDLCYTYTEKMLGGFDALVPDMQKEIKIYDEHIRERYLRNLPAGVVPDKATPLVSGVQNLADYLVKEIESRVALQGEEMAFEFLERIPDQYWGEKGREAVLSEIYPNRAEIAQWIGKESPELLEIIKGRLGESLKQVIAAPLLKLSYNFIHHLDNLERKSPEKLFEFVFNAVPLVSDQLQTANNIAKQNHKKFIHEVDPLIMLREFESQGKLHPAMPGFAEMKALQDEDHYIQQLEKQAERMDRPGGNSRWYENVDRLQDITNAPEAIRKQLELGPDYYLREAKTNRKLLEQKIDSKLKQHFYNDFSKYLLKMGGIHGSQDLPGSEEFWNLLGMSKEDSWDLLNDLAPQMLLEGMRSAFAPERLNSYMANLMQALNRNLTERRQKGEWQPIQVQPPTNRRLEAKVEEMEDRCNQLIKQMERMLPGMLIKELRELPFLEAVPGKVLAESLRDALRQHPLSQLVEDGLVEGLKKLPQKLPKTHEEQFDADRRSIEENARNIDTVRSESEKTVPYFIKQMETSLFDKWKRLHQTVDKWLERTFGKAAVDAKAFIDRIFRTVFITFVMGPVYKGMRWLLSFGIEWYGRRVGRFAELARLGIVGTDEKPNYVNANLMYRLVDSFKACYPAPA